MFVLHFSRFINTLRTSVLHTVRIIIYKWLVFLKLLKIYTTVLTPGTLLHNLKRRRQ